MNTELEQIELLVPFKVSTQESAPEQFTAHVTARVKVMKNMTLEQLVELAARPRIITFSNGNRPKGIEHLKALDGSTVDIVLTPIHAKAEAITTEDKAITVLINAARAGKLTAEQREMLKSLELSI